MQASVKDLHKGQEATMDKLIDLEDRLRQNNLGFLGFPEGAKGRNPESFMEHWLTNTFGTSMFSSLYAIEREYPCALYHQVHHLALYLLKCFIKVF